MSDHRRPPRHRRKPPRLRVKARRQEPVTPLPDTVLLVLAGLLMWIVFLSMHTALAGAATKLRAPRAASPSDGATVQSAPTFSWKRVRHAAGYEFQLAADRAFESLIPRRTRALVVRNTSATTTGALANGDYFWRVRAVDAGNHAGRWSKVRSIQQRWTASPVLLAPREGQPVDYPRTPLVFRWEPIPGAYKYRVDIATDAALANSVFGRRQSITTSGTDFALPTALGPGPYYWAVTPLDAQEHPGTRSAVRSFTWTWPTALDPATQMRVVDLDPNPAKPDACAKARECLDPQLRWDPIPGATQYQVEISMLDQSGSDPRSFPAGSIVCCSEPITGTSVSPTRNLANNSGTGVPGDPGQFGYWWRVRAVDAAGNPGDWNYGPAFDKTYPLRVANLHLRDNLGDVPVDQDPSTPVVDTSSPAIVWDQLQGAASYEVHVVPYARATPTSPFQCNWSGTGWDVVTAATGWTALGNPLAHKPLGVLTNLTVSRDVSPRLTDGTAYCVRVKARRDRDSKNKEVTGDWRTMGEPAFRYVAPPAPTGSTLALGDGDYLAPTMNGQLSWMPRLLTWKPADGARGYFVVVARDRAFTKVVDIAFTNVPVYAPRAGRNPVTYPDEGSYWWAVLPTALSNGDFSSALVADDCDEPCEPTVRRLFSKSSARPQPVAPVGDQVAAAEPTFAWKPTLGARSYTLQVARDESFGNPLLTITTDSAAYTSARTLPTGTRLFWRVRANDERGLGLNWSNATQFSRTLPVPTLSPGNPIAGEGIPLFAWQPVQGAASYDMHVEQVDGTKRDFTMRASSFTPVGFYGTGVWHWQVRANFPAGTRTVPGAYTAPLPFTRHIATPANPRSDKRNGGIVLAWDQALMAKSYLVQVSTTNSFTRIVEQAVTDNMSWAPKLLSPSYRGSDLYWRVAVVDEGRNLGGWATRPLRLVPVARLALRGRLRADRASTVRVTVRGRKGRRLRGAVVRVQGAGVVTRPRRTNRRGQVRLTITPQRRGTVRFSADKAGYAPGRAKLRVR